jgi:hypothetical protein
MQMKEIADTIKGIIQVAASLLQLALLAAVIGGGWWAYSTVRDYLTKPVSLPEINLPGFGPKQPEPPSEWRFDVPAGPAVPPPPPPKLVV